MSKDINFKSLLEVFTASEKIEASLLREEVPSEEAVRVREESATFSEVENGPSITRHFEEAGTRVARNAYNARKHN